MLCAKLRRRCESKESKENEATPISMLSMLSVHKWNDHWPANTIGAWFQCYGHTPEQEVIDNHNHYLINQP